MYDPVYDLPIPSAVLVIPLYGAGWTLELSIMDALSPCIWSRVLVMSSGKVTGNFKNKEFFFHQYYKVFNLIQWLWWIRILKHSYLKDSYIW